jgi:hypothetical protein
MNVISCIDTKTLKKGSSYPVLKVIDKEHGLELFNKKYRLVGDDGVTRCYMARNFMEGDSMLNGKFVLKENVNGVKNGTVLEFINGECRVDIDGLEALYCNVSNVEDLFLTYRMKVEPYKEYLTIEDLIPGKYYVTDKGVNIVVDGDGDIIKVVESSRKYAREHYSVYKLMKFTETNPNQERINELHKLIELESSYIETSYKCIDKYKAELKELEV